MKKRVLSILLCFMMLCSLLPTAALAVEGVPDVKYINVTGGTEQEPTFGFGNPGENTMAVYISGSGGYEVADDFSGIATIINDTAVTIEGGAVNTEDVYIFGEGSLTVGNVTFTSGHEIELSDDTVDAIFGAVMTEGSDVVDISGTITAGTELVVRNAIISGTLEFAAGFEEVESGHLTISGGGSLTVEEGATVTAAQDARITALSGATINGIALYDADTSTKLSDENDSYTVEAEVENFIWLENGENSEPIKKWVLMVDGGEGDPNAPQNNEYWFEYDWRDDATVMLGEESIPSRWSESYTDPINFTANEAISFTLTPPSDGGTYNAPIVEVEVFDWTEEKPYNTIEKLTATDGTYAYTPTSDSGFVVHVWWSEEEYNYDTFGPGEGEIAVEVMINGSESATVTSDTLNGVDESKKLSVGTKTKYILDESVESIDLLITPGENEEIREIIVGWEPQTFTANEEGAVNYTWDISDEGSRYFEAVFGGTGGEGGDEPDIPENTIQVDIPGDADLVEDTSDTISVTLDAGDGEVTVKIKITEAEVYDHDGGCTVYVPKDDPNGVTFTVDEGYNAEKMQITLTDGTNFYERLTLTDNVTNITAFAAYNGIDSIPDEVEFAVTPKDGDWYTISYGKSGNVQQENGQVILERVHYNGNTYTIYDSESGVSEEDTIFPITMLQGGNSDPSSEDYKQENDTLYMYHLAYDDGDLMIAIDTVGVEIDYKFIPDYGYQVTDVRDGESLLDVFDPDEDVISSFSYTVYKNKNIHFVVEFTPTEDSINVTAKNVGSAAIENGANAAESGSLALTVADTITNNSIENAVSTFDITLDNVVSKGSEERGDWTSQIEEFEAPIELTLTLDKTKFTASDYTVYRVHGESEPEDLTATYDPETGELTFETNKFSEYTIVEKTSGGGNDSPEIPPYVPPVAPPVDTPTNDEIDIPISGDDETIHVGATVSGDTVTVDEIDMGQLDGILGSGVDTGTVTIDFSGLDSTASITTVELPANVVKEIAEAVNDPENDAESLEIVMPSGVSITFGADALSEKVSQADGADITISIESHEDADLTDAQKDAVGSRPAFDINVTSGGEHISNIGGKITIGAPYELKNNEKENGLVVWYVDNEGNRERCQGSYDPVNKRMNWETDHLSLYMIDYCPSATFADLDIDAWYIDSTDFVIANGLMNGIGDDKFDPNGTTTRAMIVTILWRLEGEPVVNSASVFNDVENGQWYSDAIAWANMNSIVEGYDGKFDPTGEITREQFAAILWRYAKYKGYNVSVGENTNILSYNDAFEVSEYAIPAMQWACGAGLMQGDGVNLTPKADATRAQAAALFQRFCENVAEK